MNGAMYLCQGLLANHIDVCFANPGTSEMHFVAALDQQPQMRCILGLFEGVVTGAADGYARMAGRPAATLLHLGSGLGNGLANLHNARRARTPMVNVVGDHATYHLAYDAPLTSDIQSIARSVSNYVATAESTEGLAETLQDCVRAAYEPSVGVSTLILPANVAWSEVPQQSFEPVARPALKPVAEATLDEAVQLLQSGKKCLLLLGGQALTEQGVRMAYTLAEHHGAAISAETSNRRITRGRGRVPIDKLPYPIDQALETLKDFEAVILIGARAPVAFFAYPGKPSRLLPEGCQTLTLATQDHDIEGALTQLMGRLGIDRAKEAVTAAAPVCPEADHGPLQAQAVCQAVAALLPEEAIVVDESLTQGRTFYGQSHHSAPHDYLQLTGGAIGSGLPLATGAAVACPDRQVINLQGDGSAMYTVQSLWTQARENLNCLTVIFSNRSYAILHGEMRNVGVQQAGHNAQRMFDLVQPELDWPNLAQSMGVAAARATTMAEFLQVFEQGLRHDGPFLIEAVV